MSKKKRSKILAAVLCATTMAAFYASPQMVYAESLNVDNDGSVTTSTNDTKPITNLTGLEGITFGVGGELGTAGMTLYMDTSYNGLVLAKPGGEGQQLDVRGSALTVGDLYIVADDAADATDGRNRYSLRHVLGIQREGSGLEGVTRIEFGDGHGGMEVKYDSVNILDGAAIFSNAEGQTDGNILDGAAIFSNAEGQTDGGTINFDGKFDSAQGMTVGKAYELDENGNVTTTGEVTAGTGDHQYSLTQVGDLVNDINEKTLGIDSYDAEEKITSFNGSIEVEGIDVNTITSGTVTIDVRDAADTLKLVNDPDKGLEATYNIADENRTDIATLNGTVEEHGKSIAENAANITALDTKVNGFDGRIAQNSNDIKSLQDVTNGMSYNDSTGTTFEQEVTATDFKIGDTSLNAVAQAVNDPTKGLTATNELANANKSNIDTINSTINNTETGLAAAHTKIGALDGRVTTAEGEIDALQSTTNDHESRITANTNNISTLNTTVEGHTTQISGLDTRVGEAETDISALEQKTHGFDEKGDTLTLNSINATTGTVGSVTFNGGVATGLTNINSTSITVAGNTLTDGSFNGVGISNTDGKATINGISIYQDQSTQDYYVGNVNISDLTGGGSDATVEGIVRTDNTPQVDDDNNFTTTIEGALAVNSETGDTTVKGTVTAKDFVVNGGASLSSVAGQVNNTTTGLAATYDIATANKAAIEDTTTGLKATYDIASANKTAIEDQTTGLKATYDIATANKAAIEDETTGLDALNAKTSHFNTDGSELTGLKNIISEKGTIGGIGFEGNAITNVKTIGADGDVINLAGNAISKGSFNGVAIGAEGGHATFNGVSIYKDAQNENDVMVGGINLSDLQSGTSTKLEGIERSENGEGGYITTIEQNLKVNTNGEIANHNGSFKVAKDGTVTGKDFKVGDTTFSSVAADLNTAEGEIDKLQTATTGMTYTKGTTDADGVTEFDHKLKSTAFETENLTATTGKLGNISFSGSSLGSAGETITVAGAEITSNSFNDVAIYQQDDDYYLGDVNVSALEAGNTEITNKLRGITYSNEQGDDYTMTFAGVMSVSTTGEYEFNYKGKSYGLDDLINTVDVGDLDKVKDLATRVDKIEDKTTGIEFNKDTGETTISHMNGTDTNDDGINDTFSKGDSFLAVNENGITANGDTFVKGESGSAGGGSGAGTGTEKSDHFVDGNQTVGGDQYVNGDQYVTGDVNATNGNYTGSVGVGGDVFIDANADHQLNDGEISLSGVNQKVEDVSIKVDGIGDVSSVNSNIAGDSDEDGTNDLAGAVNNEYQQRVEADNALNERINSIDNRMGELEDRIDKVGAMAAAIANLRTMGYDPAAPTEIAVGIGQYRSETGAALGLFHYPNRDFMLSLSVSTSGDEVMGGIGATWKFGRKSPEKAAAEKAEKARAAKLQKAEAIKEAARLKKIEAQQQRHAKLAAEKAAE